MNLHPNERHQMGAGTGGGGMRKEKKKANRKCLLCGEVSGPSYLYELRGEGDLEGHNFYIHKHHFKIKIIVERGA